MGTVHDGRHAVRNVGEKAGGKINNFTVSLSR